ncbi:hypothetical protein Ae168Ps1_5299c [Pseudonocardia sp. Ae168_Ps1]|uniref:hypothetical protein n=1 Tax=unclassified Pseudonocardia TaxID=2619320 RepID=UPI00095E69E2|nr:MULTISPECIES: hypothetical protein [unclassified Pseudonocardia]OLL76879.1 hypothetical protein Ae150APs1_5257c [Pseudonocardia sp. Ae150A_Ps1]OLL82893.1 hypothetical protein Ae168Ps1_5299c [Pseudonocardia sp. Ae168_Ps1]OLL82995.1 hypothetical protein Ae263Ps1_0050 [Pseudonocardia sp. Ae263_Ps1]OLL90967.1 hypothetical protein Ae356Ps1_0864c [Pseudonocardia sp. Ae356_Ps1]
MNGQSWESMTPEQRRAEWDRFRYWQQQREQQRPQTAVPARHVQLGTPTARRGLLIGVIALVVGLGLVTIIDRSTDVTGRMTVVTGTSALSASSYGSGGSCVTYGGYDDITEGTAVTVRDSSGAIVGVGNLEAGQSDSYGCTFPFTVTDVPNSAFYTVEISHRGEVTFTADDVETGEVQLSLG